MKNMKLPELLSPAGSFEALRAAIDGGADAVYMGGASFNARMNAENFSPDSTGEAVKLAHSYGVKLYQTINVMVLDRERDELLRSAEASARSGIDAFIVSDLGAAELINSYLPQIPLHASTQMSVHNTDGAKLLGEYGFCRVVPARELSRDDIKIMVDSCGLEVEMFVHGALCVSHSGQCLFSSMVGGRSGNRGLCAQPCRLPYSCDEMRASDKYPLSLKDLSLASHINEIIESGVASLKIEGRMKSPEYVRGTTKIWRQLLDEGRDAEAFERRRLEELFSRGGFTDGYYTQSIGRGMLGIRSDEDKQASREVERFNKITRKAPIDMSVTLVSGKNALLTVTDNKRCVTVTGDIPMEAINAPLDEQSVRKCMAKLGDTPFYLDKFELEMCGRIMMPISALNSLRRRGVEKLLELTDERKEIVLGEIKHPKCSLVPKKRNVGRFYLPEGITEAAREFFDIIMLPLDKFTDFDGSADGFWMPEVIFDSEWKNVKEKLEKAVKKCPEYIIISNLGQIKTVKELFPDTKLIADFRFNTGNQSAAEFLERCGFESYVASPELTLPQLRDLRGAKAAVVYGRIPLMLLEKCVIKELYGDKAACNVCGRSEGKMKDRRGFVFPIMRTAEHRNIVFNSIPTYMADRQDKLLSSGLTDRHFIFTTESRKETDYVIEAYKSCREPNSEVRRI